jgi:3-phosphoshikimate 1-carboxyvinyltransferase
VGGSKVTIPAVGLNPLRTGLLVCLQEMGADIVIRNRRTEGGEPVGDLEITGGPLRAVDVPGERAPSMIDEYPILAVAACCASGTTRLRGLRELRVKESDRLAATAALLSVNGAKVEIEGDDMIVHGTGAPPAGGGVSRPIWTIASRCRRSYWGWLPRRLSPSTMPGSSTPVSPASSI